MKARTRRLGWVVVGLVVLGIAVTLVLRAFQDNMVFFYTPTQVASDAVPHGRPFRIGGLVVDGSLQRDHGLDVTFRVTDTGRTIQVAYTGLLPDLFREGKGVVALGTMGQDGVFHASQILAKHDENYMPPEAAAALRASGQPIEGSLFAGQKSVTTQPAAPAAPKDAPTK
ncbi:MAG: cytochrome c maturation protein CcmE [Burkholderiaceae bacterium]|jgi:cytochrome c-type biogenesis protein CcmE